MEKHVHVRAAYSVHAVMRYCGRFKLISLIHYDPRNIRMNRKLWFLLLESLTTNVMSYWNLCKQWLIYNMRIYEHCTPVALLLIENIRNPSGFQFVRLFVRFNHIVANCRIEMWFCSWIIHSSASTSTCVKYTECLPATVITLSLRWNVILMLCTAGRTRLVLALAFVRVSTCRCQSSSDVVY